MLNRILKKSRFLFGKRTIQVMTMPKQVTNPFASIKARLPQMNKVRNWLKGVFLTGEITGPQKYPAFLACHRAN